MLDKPIGRRTSGQIEPGNVGIEMAARQHHQPFGLQARSYAARASSATVRWSPSATTIISGVGLMKPI